MFQKENRVQLSEPLEEKSSMIRLLVKRTMEELQMEPKPEEGEVHSSSEQRPQASLSLNSLTKETTLRTRRMIEE